MALARIFSRTELGLEAPLVHVEVHLGAGLPGFSIVGLPAPVVRESRERVRSALLNSGYSFPARRITVNLAPVELSKRGGRFDLPIALAVLAASEQLRVHEGTTFECYGELGLGGELKPVRGLFLAALHAARARHTLVVPRLNLSEVDFAGLKDVLGVEHLRAAAAALSCGQPSAAQARPPAAPSAWQGPASASRSPLDACYFERIVGQWQAKRALVIAAAGAHSLLILLTIGPTSGTVCAFGSFSEAYDSGSRTHVEI